MGLFLFRFWPALMPLVLYLVWLAVVRRRARKAGDVLPSFRDGPVYWMVIATLSIAAICLLLLGSTQEALQGEFIPAHMENGRMVPAQVRPHP